MINQPLTYHQADHAGGLVTLKVEEARERETR